MAHANLGFLQYNRSQLQPALENLRSALQLDPLLEYPRFHIWLIRVRMGESEAATQELASHVKTLSGRRRRIGPPKSDDSSAAR